jgi:hypothetical protein
VVAIGVISTIGSFVLQISGLVDFWNYLIVPIVSFFTMPIPLYSIPLALLVVLAILIFFARTGSSVTITPSNPLDRAEILDSECMRYVALLCQTPQTADFLKQKYQESFHPILNPGVVTFEYCLKELEERELIIFQDGKWTVTQKALAYIAKYHG